MRRTIVLGCCAALVPSTAVASFAAPVFPRDEICALDPDLTPQRRVVEPLLLIRHLIEAGSVRDAALDTDGDGDTLLVEKQLTFTQPDYCEAPERNCTPVDAAAIRRLHDQLAEFVRTQGGAWYTFERLRQPDAVDPAETPALDPAFHIEGQPFQIGEVLDASARYVRIVCRDAPAPAPPVVADADPPASDVPDRWVRAPERGEGFRLTGSIDHLSRNRTRLSAAEPATFSINSDLEGDRRTYFIDVVAGYDFEFARGAAYETSLIPFAVLNRLLQDSGSEVNRLGVGTQTAVSMHGGALGYGEVALTPLYLTDTTFSSDIGTLKLRWSPTLTEAALVPLGFYQEYGALLAQLELDLLSDVGHVFDAGGNPELADDNNFFRVGGRLGLSVRGAPGSLLERIELNVSNRFLRDLEGRPRDLNLFRASLSYLFPNVDNYRLSFSYTSGRSEDTLTDVQFWSTELGVRF